MYKCVMYMYVYVCMYGYICVCVCMDVYMDVCLYVCIYLFVGARCSSVVRAFAHGAMGRRIDPSWWTYWAISRSRQCPLFHLSGSLPYV